MKRTIILKAQQDFQGREALHLANLSLPSGSIWLGRVSVELSSRLLGSAVLGELLGEGRDAPSHKVGKGGTFWRPSTIL